MSVILQCQKNAILIIGFGGFDGPKKVHVLEEEPDLEI